MKQITNTKRDEANPSWLMGGAPNNILAQEAQGQKELVNSMQLPVDIDPDDKAKLVEAGVVFGDPSPGDPIFCDALLPKGWSKQATDHSMWSKLVDDTGKVRAMIFYKAAFYDRSAFMRIEA